DANPAVGEGIFLGGDQGRFAYHFLDERRAGALGLRDQPVPVGEREVQPAAVKLKQSAAAVTVRQWELNRLINASRPRRQRRLDRVRPVGRQQKDHLGFRGQAV